MAHQARRPLPDQLSAFEAESPARRAPAKKRQPATPGNSETEPKRVLTSPPRAKSLRPQRSHPVTGNPAALPALLATLDGSALDALADLLSERLAREPVVVATRDEWLDAKRAAVHLGLSLNALHKLTASRLIPFEQDGPACKLWFRREDLNAWRAAGGARRWKR